MTKKKSFISRLLQRRHKRSAEVEALEIAEDKRLHALGIDTSGDAVDVMIQLRKKKREIEEGIARRRQKSPGEKSG